MKQVLVIYGDRRRPVTFNCGDGDDCTKEEYEWLMKAVESVFEDVLNAEEGSSRDSSGSFFLQMESSEWGGAVIDVTPRTLVPDHGIVFLHCDRHESRGSVGSKDYEKRGDSKEKTIFPAVEWCSKLKKRSANAGVIATLFPSTASSTKKKKFNPHSACVVAEKQRQKKGTNPHCKGRSRTLTVVVLKHILKTIPKKEIREDLRKEGRIKELSIRRIMSCNEARMSVLQMFQKIKLQNFLYLKCNKDSTLDVSENQLLDGNGIITLAGCGSLYLHELPLPSCSTASSTNVTPAATTSTMTTSTYMCSAVRSTAARSTSILARFTPVLARSTAVTSTPVLVRSTVAVSTPVLARSIATVATPFLAQFTAAVSTAAAAARYTMTTSTTTMSAMPISTAASTSHATMCMPTEENDCEIITTTQVSSPTKVNNSRDLEQDLDYNLDFRETRAEQDRVYEEMLLADTKKIQEEAELNQKIDKLREELRIKFDKQKITNGVKLAFKQSDGIKTEHIFSTTSTVKEMYQFVFSKMNIPIPFDLFVSHPQRRLVLQSMANLPIHSMNNTIIFVSCNREEFEIMTELENLADPIVIAGVSDNEDDNVTLDITDLKHEEIERMNYMKKINSVLGVEHIIDRADLYNDVLELYRDGRIVNECPIYIKFKDEAAIDAGGVQRDMLSGFWEVAYKKLFEGSSLLTPMVHPQIDLTLFPILGRILSHGYLVTGFLPTRIALPTLLSILLGPPVKIRNDIITEALLDFVTDNDRKIIKEALAVNVESFPPNVMQDLIAILANFGCRTPPKPSTLTSIIEQVGICEFIVKPAAGIGLINSGIPKSHQNFWMDLSVDGVKKIYDNLTISSDKILSLLVFPEFCTPQEERVSGYLRTLVCRLNIEKLRHLMRFVTGSSVCSENIIRVQFNGLIGLARRPIAHTCNSTLELPVAYINYSDFYEEMCCFLTQTENEFYWRMDSL